jgi:hypothetical protein
VSGAIYKLQPDRTVALRGFDGFGAAAALHSAGPDGFTVTGVFRDPSDFAVVILYDADNFYEHPRIKYLPDFDFSGLTLQFDVAQQDLMPLNCRKYPTIDWPFLGVERPDGTRTRIRLSDSAVVVTGGDLPAAAHVDILADQMQGYDRVTLWYLNLAFDYIVPGKPWIDLDLSGGTAGTVHRIRVREREYTHTQQAGESPGAVVQVLRNAIDAAQDPDVTAGAGAEPWLLRLAARLDNGASFPVVLNEQPAEQLWHVQASTVARDLAAAINRTDCVALGAPFGLRATAAGARIQLETIEGGYDANFVRLAATWKNPRLKASAEEVEFSGGTSDAVLRCTVDFSSLGISEVRRMWLTLAPRFSGGEPYTSTEWQAVFSNWLVVGPENKRRLRVAGPGSTRVTSTEARAVYQGNWGREEGFYQSGVAAIAREPGASVTLRYHCAYPHSLWLGTALLSGGGAVQVVIDGVPAGMLATHLPTDEPVVTRRKLAPLLNPGDHVVILTAASDAPVCFQFLEAAVESDPPEPWPAQRFFSAALDYSTDHTFKLSPARIHWIFDQLGCTGPMNEYLGVFWWNQRKAEGGVLPEARVVFEGGFVDGDAIFLHIGEQVLGKSVFATDTPETIARHFGLFINSTLTGLRASWVGGELRLTPRAIGPAFEFPVSLQVESAAGSTGAVVLTGSLQGGVAPRWVIDETAAEPLNAAAHAWHSDFFRLAALRDRAVTVACSMELVLPPPEFAARYPDGAPVETAVGFANLVSTHCTFSSAMLAYHKRVYASLAELMVAAGLTPELQFGEFTWWYFSNYSASTNSAGGMAYYDDETRQAALTELGRPLALFLSPNDDPTVNGGADSRFLSARLRRYAQELGAYLRSLFPGVVLEVLFPYDVNHPVPAGIHQLGGALNRAVNFPPEWTNKESSGLDRFKVEALDFGAWSRDLDLVLKSLRFPLEAGWPSASVSVMVPVFRGGYAWEHEVEWARSLGMRAAHLWAFDHFCLQNMPGGWAAQAASNYQD